MSRTVLHVVATRGVGLAARQLALLAGGAGTDVVHKVALLVHDPSQAAFFTAHEMTVFQRERASTLVPALFAGSALSPFGFVSKRWLSELARRAHADALHAHDALAAEIAGAVAEIESLPLFRSESDPRATRISRGSVARVQRFVAHSVAVQRAMLRAAPLLAPKMVLARTSIELPHPALPDPEPHDPLRVHVVGVPQRGDGAVLEILRHHAELVAADKDERTTLAASDVVIAAGSVPLGADAEEPVELAVLRGLAHGRPAVVVDEGGLPELVAGSTDGASCGVVLDRPAERDAWVSALLAVTGFGAAARARAKEHDATKMRAFYHDLYAGVVKRRR